MTDSNALRERIGVRLASIEAEMRAMRADKPNVIDGHSDGKRVRYVRRETEWAALVSVLALLDDLRS